MKKNLNLFTVMAICFLIVNEAQSQNNFPNSGNVSIGVQNPSHLLSVGMGNSLVNPQVATLMSHRGVYVGYKEQYSVTALMNDGDEGKHALFARNYKNGKFLPLYVGFGKKAPVILARDGSYVGVGIENPEANLHVNGHAKIKNSGQAVLEVQCDNNIGLTIAYNQTHGFGFFDYDERMYFRAPASNKSPLLLQKNGSVVIGSDIIYNNSSYQYDNQGHQLVVNGSIICEKVKVINDVPASDFVFEKDYNLLPLKDVESFVQQNKHLPEVPSAKEFKDNGYNIGEMDDLLLRKVEELTLYVIAQQKEIENLKAQITNNK